MAIQTVCDHDGKPATYHVEVDSFVGSTVLAFDCCSPECAAAYILARVAESQAEVPAPEEG